MTYKNWIWHDGMEIARLRTRMKRLEDEVGDLKASLERALTKSDN